MKEAVQVETNVILSSRLATDDDDDASWFFTLIVRSAHQCLILIDVFF